MAQSAPQELVAAIRQSKIVPVVGAGVSQGVARMPGWADFLKDCVRFLNARGIAEPTADAVAAWVECKGYARAGQAVQDALKGAGALAEALRHTFHRDAEPALRTAPILQAVWALNAPLILTTNYDRLLEIAGPAGVQTATQQEPLKMLAALRGLSSDPTVVHLHGVYDDPGSVIFSVEDYARLNASEEYKSFSAALWMTGTLLYIGASPEGIGDPDFSRLFAWGRRTFPDAPAPHFALMKAGRASAEERRTLYEQYRVHVLEYPDHDALPGLLRAWAGDLQAAAAAGQAAPAWIRVDAVLRPLAIEEVESLVNDLLALRSLQTLRGREALAARLPREVASRVHVGSSQVEDVFSLVEISLEQAGAFAQLLKRLRFSEGASSIPFQRLLDRVSALFPNLMISD